MASLACPVPLAGIGCFHLQRLSALGGCEQAPPPCSATPARAAAGRGLASASSILCVAGWLAGQRRRLRRQRRLAAKAKRGSVARRVAAAGENAEEDVASQEKGDVMDPGATYVKAWVGKVHWAGESGAVVSLQQVYGTSEHLPSTFHLPLDAMEADEFQKALFGRLASSAGGDDALCDVRIHGNPEPRAELVMNAEGCMFPHEAPEDGQYSLSDIMDLREQRHSCGVGEALGTAQRLAVPVLICTSYLLRATKACLSRVTLEHSVQRCGSEPASSRTFGDPALKALEKRLSLCLSHGPAAGSRAVGGALRAASAFAWYWALHQGSAGAARDSDSFGEFQSRYLRLSGLGGAAAAAA